MLRLPFDIEKKDCTSCTACYSICPINCIEMKEDEEGFSYPIASDACINCGKCEKICPIYNYKIDKLNFKQKAYAAVAKDKEIWRRSSSGGAFSEICHAWGDENTFIVGAAWEGLKVHSICVTGVENIAQLCKSKYLVSDLKDTYKSIKNKLDNNGRVIFCGTPCQVAGLKAFLGKNYSNILLIDLICHGVGSPLVFKSCIKVIGEQFNDEVLSYEFRTKRRIYEIDHLALIRFKSGKCKYFIKDPYIQLFLKQHCLRKSCGENCKYRNENRKGDLTIADFKGYDKVFHQLKGTKKNYSSIIVNSEKGEMIIPHIFKRMKMFSCTIDNIKRYNPLFFRQTWFSDKREEFFSDFVLAKEETIKNWTEPALEYNKSVKRKVYDILPTWMRKLIIKRINRRNYS